MTENCREMVAMGVDAVITDNPVMGKRQLMPDILIRLSKMCSAMCLRINSLILDFKQV